MMLASTTAERVGNVIGTIIGILLLVGFFWLIGYIIYVFTWKRRWEERFLRHFNAGDRRKARRQLDRYAKPIKKPKVPNRKVARQRGRVICLWLLGDLEELRAELAAHHGSATYLANVEINGALALLLEAPPDQAAAQAVKLGELAAKVLEGSTTLLAGMRTRAQRIARVGAAIAGQPFDEANVAEILDTLYADSLLTRVLVLRALVVASERHGRSGLRVQKMLANLTPHFTTPAAA